MAPTKKDQWLKNRYSYVPSTMADINAMIPKSEEDTETSSGRRYKRTRGLTLPQQSNAIGPTSGMEHYTMNQAGVPVYHPPQSRLIPGKPPQKNPFTILQDKIKIMENFHDPIVFHKPVGIDRHALWLQAKREGEHRQKDPVWRTERAVWDAQMSKLGLTPEGRSLSGLRNIMIERMNQLRGGM